MPYYDCIWGRKGRFVCEYWIIMANSKLLLGTLEALCVCVVCFSGKCHLYFA